MRAAALSLDYPDQEGPYPGRNSVQRLEIPGLSHAVSNIVGEPLKPIEPLESHGKCRVATGRDGGRGAIHVDSSQWSGILYLSRPEDCKGGTEFYRHRKTGLERAPITDAEAREWGYASQAAVIEKTITADGLTRSAWQKVMEIPMRYNRLILLRPWFFHTAGPGFGKTLEEARLIHVMFFTLNG